MEKRQVYNPYLPLHEYIPDVEPHVFGDRVYVFGSHDKEGGYTFCMLDYVCYSAPVDDLTNWRYEGVIYRKEQDPEYPKMQYMYAPDVVQGNDGRFYLYYCMGGDYGYGGYIGHIHVAVCDTPAGKYEYLGYVRNPDHSPMKRYICFDPALLNDNGVIRLYYGTRYGYEEEADFLTDGKRLQEEAEMFGRSKEEILSYPDSIMGPVMAVLSEDMLTVKEMPRHIIPYKVKGTDFEAHPFFEGASMRKVGEKYYFIYSSWQNHELCYAVSDAPDSGFCYGGTIVSNGDVGYLGREEKDKLNMTGTTHGSIVCIQGKWYVFYHRLTHKSDYSRQACAEKIEILADGTIPQVEVSSCGLNGGPLCAAGNYPAVIACNITNGHMPHGSNSIYATSFPNVTNLGEERFVAEISEGTMLGYKYFSFSEDVNLSLEYRFENETNRVIYTGPLRLDERCVAEGVPEAVPENGRQMEECEALQKAVSENVRLSERPAKPQAEKPYFEIRIKEQGPEVARIDLEIIDQWNESKTNLPKLRGVHPIYLVYHGTGSVQLKTISFLTGR
ncbi:MAG: family 43 glycosylhydrolase [Lachnospiraceae bacterium]